MTTATGTTVEAGVKYCAIRYIGKQPFHKDTVLYRPGLRWNHQGDVRWVPEGDALIYIRYLDIWEYAFDVEVPQGGLIALASAGSKPQAPPSDPKSQGLARVPADQRTPAPFETDAKAENPVVNAIAEFVNNENITVAAAQKRIEEIVMAVRLLKGDEFAPDGKPKCDALKRVLGRTVLTAERDCAWGLLRQTLNKQAAAIAEGVTAAQLEETPATDPVADLADAVP